MKPLASESQRGRSAFWLYLRLLYINIVNTWQTDTAYFAHGWGNVLSTVAFTITYLVFISVLFANVRTLAGFTRDQMLFLLLVVQVNFYLMWAWAYNNAQRLVDDVNRGNFDLLLTKPLPALFYSSIRNISLLQFVRDGLPAILFVVFSIHWGLLAFQPLAMLAGVALIVAGQIATQSFLLLLALPVFWFGQSNDLLNLGYPLMDADMPYAGVQPNLRVVLTLFIPSLTMASLPAAVMLGKFDILTGLGFGLGAAALLSILKVLIWKSALRHYTSASS